MKTSVTHDRLLEVLDYDPDTGVFLHKRTISVVKAGDEAGSTDKDGYVIIGIDGKVYRAHRLAWLYIHGKWPKFQIDHINGNPDDNRIANLREAKGPTEQQQNQMLRRSNKSGCPGVYWDTTNKRWRAMIRYGGKKHSLGAFEYKNDAISAYLKAKAVHHTFQPKPRELAVPARFVA